MTGPATDPPPEPPAEPDVTEDEVGAFFDTAIGAPLIGDGVPADAVAKMRTRHIAAVFASPEALAGIRDLRRTVPPMDVLLAPYVGPNVPLHGRGSLPHGYTWGCRDDDDCNNLACPVGDVHLRCTVACLATAGRELLYLPVWRHILLGSDPSDGPTHLRTEI